MECAQPISGNFIMSFEVLKSAESTIFAVVPEAGLEPARYR